MTHDDFEPNNATWVRATNGVIFLLSLFAIVPVCLLAWIMVSWLTEPGHSGPSIANGWTVAWAVVASLMALLHIVLSAVGIARPKRSATLRMLTNSVVLLVTCPLLWAAIFGLS